MGFDNLLARSRSAWLDKLPSDKEGKQWEKGRKEGMKMRKRTRWSFDKMHPLLQAMTIGVGLGTALVTMWCGYLLAWAVMG